MNEQNQGPEEIAFYWNVRVFEGCQKQKRRSCVQGEHIFTGEVPP